MTLSALIICFGIGQLVCGPLSDRFGRRPVLLGGMALYTVASVLASASQSIDALIGWRALQGAALAAAVTCGRALVRDLFQPHEGARVMSRALGGLGVVGMLAPLTGGLLVHFVSWHAALLSTAVFGAATLAFMPPGSMRRCRGATRARPSRRSCCATGAPCSGTRPSAPGRCCCAAPGAGCSSCSPVRRSCSSTCAAPHA
jgi:MFS family permease